MPPGLRERKRAAAVRAIQEIALDLFDARGFDEVTIEEIAAEAEVSASTVYRYFGTKEALIVSDEFDDLSQEALAALLDTDDLAGTVRRIVANYEPFTGPDLAAGAGHGPWRRVRYFFSEPAVRQAVYASLDRASTRIAETLVAERGMSPTKAHVAAHALVYGYFAALEQWHADGAGRPIAGYVEEAMVVLDGLLSPPDQVAARRPRRRA